MARTFKAAILVEQKQPLVIGELELPERLDYGQVLVKIHYTSICGAQLNEIEGVKGPDKFLPHLLGHEGGGVVEAVGPGVTSVKPGDHVVLHWRKGAGIQAATPKYSWNGRTVNAGWVTTFSEYSVVSENRVTPIPKEFPLDEAPLYGCAMTTAFGVVHNDARLRAGDSILIVGSGGVGSAIARAAALAGAYPIIAVDVNAFKLSMAPTFGATHVIDSRNEDVRKRVLELVPGGVDVAVDTTGIKPIRELCYELTNAEGTTVLVGVPKKGKVMSIDSFPLHFTKRITGSHGGDSVPNHDIPRLVRLQQSGRFDVQGMVTKTFTLDQINEAIQQVCTGDVIRCMIKLV
jgi:S-(hydroxymethyl)glutathione dehydrogenase/alcohol dehydrogenase